VRCATGWCGIINGLKTGSIKVGSTVAAPEKYRCPSGYKCREGTSIPEACCFGYQPPGINMTGAPGSCALYQPSTMQSECVRCPAGVSCVREGNYSNRVAPCPPGHYCGEGQLPKACGDGFYGNGRNMSTPQDCTECPPGKWCTGGKISGNCLPGHICSLRSKCASPGTDEKVCPAENFVTNGQTIFNGLCPEGSYCPEGTPFPVRCPAGTRLWRDAASWPGRQACDCVHCDAGQMCVTGSIYAQACPKGFYCPGQSASSENPLKNCTPASKCGIYSLPVPCPAGTYQPLQAQDSSSSCLTCGEYDTNNQGHHCPQKNSSYQSICPAGHFCLPGRGPAVPCPAGYSRSLVGGHELSSCSLCGGGKFCPNGTVVPINCAAGTYCPPGSPSPRICEGGFYCPANSTSTIPCQPGTYCIGGNEFPLICQPGTFCPAKSTLPTLCPIGTHANPNMTINRTNIEVACAPCPRGTFGADPLRLSCEACWAGYVCYGNTTRGDPQNVTNHRGEICPAGSYCGNGSYAPSPCPRGTFNPEKGQVSVEACQKCPRNSFNNVTGQPACIPCGGSAVSTDDSLACECKGANRVFHPFDSACRCKAGFTIYSGAGVAQPDDAISDGILDCEPVVLKRCEATQLRSQSGDCLDPCDDTACVSPPCYCQNEVDFCNASCPSFQTPKAEKVQVDDVIGTVIVCSCSCPADSSNPKCADPNQVPIEKKYEFASDSAGTTVLTITDAAGAQTYLVPGMASGPSASAESQFIGSSPEGFSGVLDAPSALFDALGMLPCTMDSEGLCVEDAASASRRVLQPDGDDSVDGQGLRAGPAAYHRRQELLPTAGTSLVSHRRKSLLRAAALDDSEVVGVQSPLVCIKGGQGIMWSITSANGVDHYPEYVSDSLFNTNPSFDYGAFVGLAESVKRGYAVTSFYYAFEQAGVYTFRDAGDKTKETVVGVVDPVVDCPRAFETNPIQPLSADILKSFPTSTEDQNNIITPNYDLIMSICIGLAGVLLVMLAALYIRKTRGWGQAVAARPKYRKLGEFEDFHQMASRKENVRRGAQSGAADEGSLGAGLSLDEVDDLGAGYVDLEGFNVQMLFDKLQDQTHLVAEQLTQQKHDVREFYDKVTRETVTLRTLVDKHSQSGFSAEMVRRAERRQREIDRELMRRKELGADALPKFERCLHLNEGDAKARVEEAARLDQAWQLVNAQELSDEVVEGLLQLDDDKLSRVDAAISSLRESIKERKDKRAKVLYGDGAVLLDRSRKPVERNVLFDGSGALKPAKGLVEQDALTGILVPKLGTEMKCNGRHNVSVPPHCCIHPTSGEVVPMEGNVYLDATEETLFVMNPKVPAQILCSGPVPYVVNYKNPEGNCYPSSEALYAHLILEEDKGWPLNENRDMLDPHTGLRVPVLAVTHDLRTQEIVAVGGSMLDPETRLMKPIQLGDIMQDPESKDVLVIMGVKIDEASARVMPIGARYLDDNTGEQVTMVFGAPIRDEFSGQPCTVRRCISDPLNPSRTLAVDDDMCAVLAEVEDAKLEQVLAILEEQVGLLKSQRSGIRSSASLGGASPRINTSALKQKMEPLMRHSKHQNEQLQDIRKALNTVTLDQFVLVRDQHHRMYDLAETGGQKGALVDPVTERELPILIGCFMYDEASKSEVQILDLEVDEETGLYEPLGCTVVDPLSGRLVSATICGQMKDPFSSNLVPISGVRRDAATYHVQAESNIRCRPTNVGHANFDAKLLADLLKHLSNSTSGSHALASLLGDVAALSGGQAAKDESAPSSRPQSALVRPGKKRPSMQLSVASNHAQGGSKDGSRQGSRPGSSSRRSGRPGTGNSTDSQDLIRRYVQKLNDMADQHRTGDDDDKTSQAFNELLEAAERELRALSSTLQGSRDKILAAHLEKAQAVMADPGLSCEKSVPCQRNVSTSAHRSRMSKRCWQV